MQYIWSYAKKSSPICKQKEYIGTIKTLLISNLFWHFMGKNQCAIRDQSKQIFMYTKRKMFLTWIRWSSRVGPRGKDPGPRGRDPGPIGGAPNPWGVPNVSIPREIFTGSPLDRIVEQWCTECWDAFNQGFLFPFPVKLLFSNCQYLEICKVMQIR